MKERLHGPLLAALAAAACTSGAPDGVRPSEGYLTGGDGARIHYRVVGMGPDTVVVVHGGPGAGIGSVAPEFEPLAEDLTLIFYDQRGGGRSELPADTARLHARFHVEDLDSVRAHFGLDRMKLLAHSFGAVLAARYAETHPDRVGRLVLHGATGPVRREAARLARAAAPSPDTALTRRASELLGSLLEGAATAPVEACREWEAIGRRLAEARGEPPRWRGSTCDAPPEAVAYYYRRTAQVSPRTFGDWDFTERLEAVRAPVLVVAGDRDSAALEAQRAWVSSYPDARLLLVPGAGKGTIAERPERVRRAVTDFLRGP